MAAAPAKIEPLGMERGDLRGLDAGDRLPLRGRSDGPSNAIEVPGLSFVVPTLTSVTPQ
jgi:hypothetical protein